MIEIKNLVKIYPGAERPAVNNISVNFARGEFVAIIGLSGSGKSTLLRCINRLVAPTSGSIGITWKGGETVDAATVRGRELRRMRAHMGMIFQHFNLVRRQSVLQNVIHGSLNRLPLWRSLLAVYPEPILSQAMAKLARVGIPEQAYKRADRLSGGQQQRVAIARALMQDIEVMLADEPVSALDPAISRSVMDHLRDLNRTEGITILCNLHFLDLVREYADRAVALKDGQIVFDGPPAEITNERFKAIYGEAAKEVSTR